MEVKVVISLDDRTTSLLEKLTATIGGRVQTGSKLPLSEVVQSEKSSAGSRVIKEITLEDIRTIARKLADEGRQSEYKPILNKYGYAKVNNIEEFNYQVIYDEMSALVAEN